MNNIGTNNKICFYNFILGLKSVNFVLSSVYTVYQSKMLHKMNYLFTKKLIAYIWQIHAKLEGRIKLKTSGCTRK